MATSFTRTREQLRDMILRKLSVFEEGQDPSPSDTLSVYEGLDLRLKEMHAIGTLWWKVQAASVPVTITSGVATASLPADFLFPVSLRFPVGIGGDSDEIEIVGHTQFQSIPDKSEKGQPRQALFSGQTLYLNPVPQGNGTIQLTYEAIIQDTEQSTPPDIPVPMLRCLAVIVAYDLADSFSVPEQKIRRLREEASSALTEITILNRQRVKTSRATPDYF